MELLRDACVSVGTELNKEIMVIIDIGGEETFDEVGMNTCLDMYMYPMQFMTFQLLMVIVVHVHVCVIYQLVLCMHYSYSCYVLMTLLLLG